jgi:signal transduction histidine kinase
VPRIFKEPVAPESAHEGAAVFDYVEAAFLESLSKSAITPEAREDARARARTVLDAVGGESEGREQASLVLAAELFVALAAELTANEPALRQLVTKLERACVVPRARLGREMLLAARMLQLPDGISLEAELMLLLSLGDFRAVSLWTMWPSGDLRHIAHAGEFDPEGMQTRRLARRVFNKELMPPDAGGAVAGLMVERGDGEDAALVALGPTAASPENRYLLESAAGMLAAMLERKELLARGGGEDLLALEATERRLARVRFDLHDGPQQDVILLAEDLALFRTQLESVIEGHTHGHRLLGRLEDLQARLVALDGDLRRVYVSVKSPFLQAEPLPDALAQITDDFASRTHIDPDVQLKGDFSKLTDSQQIALLSLIREALSNVREHSEATNVEIAVSASGDALEATVTDDGNGFDPEVTLVRAAREGHLGLVGMHERVRLLGGRTQIDSRPGGPTVISISLPPPPTTPGHPGA